jgi:hypothetical protein
MRIKTNMSYDPKILLNRYLNLNRLNSSINFLPSIVDPFDIHPHGLFQKNRNRFTQGSMINKIQDVPKTSAMGTELLEDLRIRQEEFLKRIRKHPSKTDDPTFMV